MGFNVKITHTLTLAIVYSHTNFRKRHIIRNVTISSCLKLFVDHALLSNSGAGLENIPPGRTSSPCEPSSLAFPVIIVCPSHSKPNPGPGQAYLHACPREPPSARLLCLLLCLVKPSWFKERSTTSFEKCFSFQASTAHPRGPVLVAHTSWLCTVLTNLSSVITCAEFEKTGYRFS